MPKEDKVYRLAVGIFDEKKNETNWHDVEEFDDFDKAQKEFRKYVGEQLKYSDDEFDKVWKTPRLDIELLMGDTLLNWVGVYARGNKADVGKYWFRVAGDGDAGLCVSRGTCGQARVQRQVRSRRYRG